MTNTPDVYPHYKDLRIVFMGTPEFAVESLDALVKEGMNVVGVVTAPDKPAGRGMNLTASAVKHYALTNNIPVLQPTKLKDPSFLQQLKELQPDLQVVVAFRMLPEIVWNLPPYGTINVHASLLPNYRGAAPINWAIINGENETGITTFQLQHEIDTGHILLQKKTHIREDETAGELHDELKLEGAALLTETIRQLCEGRIKPQPQQELLMGTAPKHAPKIFTDTCKLNFQQSVDQVYNLIRGLSPYPGAFTILDQKIFKIWSANKEKLIPKEEPGTLQTDGKSYIKIACADGYIIAKQIQLEGKKKMQVEEFLRGYRLENTLLH